MYLPVNIVNISRVSFQIALMQKNLNTDVTLNRFDVTEAVNFAQVSLKMVLPLKNLRADVTLKSLDVTDAVNSSHV